MVKESSIDVSNVLDEPKNFSQSLIFTACIVRDPELAFKMIKVLIELGVDPKKEDTLKQTPLFYACRQGNAAAIEYFITEGKDNVNRQDMYG